MITCFACDCEFPNNLLFLNHIELVHSSLPKFVCPENDCNRTYSSYNSYKKHRRAKHALQEIDKRVTDLIRQELALMLPSDKLNTEEVTLESSLVDDFLMQLDCQGSVDNGDSDSDEETFSKPVSYIASKPTPSQHFSESGNIATDELLFIAKLYKYTDVQRARVCEIIQDTTLLIERTLANVKNEFNNLFTSSQNNSVSPTDIAKVFDKFSNPFKNIKTEAQSFSEFKNRSTFIMPENFLLGEKPKIKEQNGVKIVKNVPIFAQFIPLREVFQKFFELPGILEKTLNYQNKILNYSNVMENIIQGNLWKKKIVQYGDKIVFPFTVYSDDYQNNNPLGSHKGIGKCAGVYASVLILPPELRSKVENNFLFMLFNTRDRQTFKNKIVFSRLIDEIKFLQKYGITVSTPTGNKQIYFVFILLLGDNLGLHSLLGFNESFRSNLFCRFCLTIHDNINLVFKESNCQLRTPENYK